MFLNYWEENNDGEILNPWMTAIWTATLALIMEALLEKKVFLKVDGEPAVSESRGDGVAHGDTEENGG